MVVIPSELVEILLLSGILSVLQCSAWKHGPGRKLPQMAENKNIINRKS